MIITEHSLLPEIGSIKTFERSAQYPDGLLLNAHASPFDQKYFFVWNNDYKTPCYTASYIIGAQRIEGEELIIQPKMKNIDFMKMFSVCLECDLSPESFSHIYNIDLDAKPIMTKTNISVSLTPLLIVHFLMLMKRITSRGLRSDYIERNENLKKVKGRIDIRNNERKNVIYKRFDKVYCNYSERSLNIPENRLFKKTLLICKRYINRMVNHELYPELFNRINICLSTFEDVDENVELQEIRNSKRNTLYRDYDSAVKLALSILRRLDYSITNVEDIEQLTPVFWIDMALLYEHYVYSLLHNAYGSDVKYQKSGWFRWKPDFLHIGEKLIMDTKYIPDLDYSGPSGDIVGQLSGYSRIESFTSELGVDDETVVPCLIIYPYISDNAKSYHFNTTKKLLDQASPIEHLIKFYKLGVPMPRIM
ncbi:MAG: hypothetical protein IKE94_01770 [Aeriscardovia sp.]|nr:hypothetical protein [Aeriscardovia sp.]